MAGELQFNGISGVTHYFLIRNRSAQIWSVTNTQFEAYATANYTDFDIAAVEQGTASGYYVGNFPSSITAGVYNVVAKRQIGANPAESDPVVAAGEVQWNGSTILPLADLATSGQIGQLAPMRIARGTMIEHFLFDMVSSADHVTPFTSGVISGQIARDNGSVGPLQSGQFTEVGLGTYRLRAFTSGDLLANTAMVVFTGVGISGGAADPRRFSFVLQRTSGQ